MKFEDLTLSQQAAVKEQGSILVSAAAGSGKTAVLVERIIDELTRADSPLSAERLLVVTFTVAAAGEMRARLENALGEYCKKHPYDMHAAKQKLLLSSAKICTIDSFCIDLLRENFEKADVDPDFKIAEESELLNASAVALARVMQNKFNENSEDFAALLDAFGCVYDESNLTSKITEIYEKSQNLPFGKQWLNRAAEICGENNFDYWMNEAFSFADQKLGEIVVALNGAIDYSKKDEAVYSAYSPALIQAVSQVEKMKTVAVNKEWNELFLSINNFKFERFGSVKGSAENYVAVKVKAVKDFVTDKLKSVSKLFFDTKENVLNGYEKVGAYTKLLLQLTLQYAEEYEAELKERSVLGFSDVEQKALALLCKYENDKIVQKEESKELIEAFDEILVDEFQDVNDLQDMLFHVLSDNSKHLFAVGDVKQSIYGFRGANPNNFLKRRKEAVDYNTPKENAAKKIILDSNFRSTKDVCDFTNFFFSLFMTEKNCGMQYEAEDHLVAKASIPQSAHPDVEVHLVEANEYLGEKLSSARHIADYIQAVMSEEEAVYDKSLKTMRKAKYSDFAIILRKMKGDSNLIAAELKKRGIPVSYSKQEFLESREIAIAVSLLSVISNPTRDIDLLCVMASPIFAFTPEEIAKIRVENKNSSFYSAVIKSAENNNEKAKNLVETLNGFRRLTVLYSLPKLISVLYEKTGLLNTVSMMSDGELRRANLMLLLNQAESYDKTAKDGLEGFLNFLKSEDAQKIKPATLGATSDAVRIMSAHYSKGLQFPICILGFLSSAFNSADVRSNLIFDSDYGISFNYYSSDGKNDSLVREVLSLRAKERMLAEELRLFYVALTRAENRLVMMLSANDAYSAVNKASFKNLSSFTSDTYESFVSANSIGDWVLSALLLHPEASLTRQISGDERLFTEEKGRLDFKICQVEYSDVSVLAESVAEADNNLTAKLCERFAYEYPFKKLLSLPSKTSVSSLVHTKGGDEEVFLNTPSFMLKDGLNATQKGTAIHKVMQFINFDNAEKDLEAELERLKEWEFISEEEYKAVDKQHIKAFIESKLFLRMKSSGTLKREMRFITALNADFVLDDCDADISEEPIIVQGAMDCVFVEEDGVVIVDFKTDRVYNDEELVLRYKRQLDVYAEACKKIFEKEIKEKIIYSLFLDREIIV